MSALHHHQKHSGAAMRPLFKTSILVSLIGASFGLAAASVEDRPPVNGDAVALVSGPRAVNRGAAKGAADAKAVDVAETAAAALPSSINLQSAQQQEMLLAAPISRIAIADPSVADALVMRPSKANGDHGSLLLFGKRSGTTNLLIWYRGRAKASSVNLVVDGDDLKGTGLRSTGPVLAGSAPSMVAHAQASELIRQNLPEKAGKALIDQSTVATSGTVQVDVKVVEFSKTALKQVGTNFSFVKGKYFFDSLFTTASSLQNAFNLVGRISDTTTASLRLLQSNGMARVLAEPTLVAQSGHSASFLAGGEIPIPVSQGLGSVSVEYKPFGIGLAVTPTVLSADRIALKVAPQASDLDYTNAVSVSGSPVPALLTRKADTTVELGDGESFVIGGLISKNTVSSVNKVPLLGDLPVIGAFFKNLNFQSDEKELVIIVTPHLVKPLAREARLPNLPGDGADAANAPVWTPYVLGVGSRSFPGFSQ